MVVLLAATTALSACSILEPLPSPTPTPTPTAIDTTRYIGGVINPANTVWVGKDSGGDETTLTLHGDGTVAVTFAKNAYNDPNDTWKVEQGVLHIDVYLDPTHGEAHYTGTWNAETSSITAVMTTSVSNRSLTVTLVKQ